MQAARHRESRAKSLILRLTFTVLARCPTVAKEVPSAPAAENMVHVNAVLSGEFPTSGLLPVVSDPSPGFLAMPT